MIEQIRQWYLVEKRSYRWIMKSLGINNARRLKRLLSEAGIKPRERSEAVATQWLNNPERRKQNSDLAKKSFAPFWGLVSKRPEVRVKISKSKMGSKNPMWGIRGPDNHAWLGGKKSWEKGRKMRPEKKKALIQQLGGACQKCGVTKNLTLHHDPPWRIVRSHDLKYLHVLCNQCHFQGPNHLR